MQHVSVAWLSYEEDPSCPQFPMDASDDDIFSIDSDTYFGSDPREDPRSQAALDYQNSIEWQEWFAGTLREDTYLLSIEDRSDVRFTVLAPPSNNPTAGTIVTLQVPPTQFLTNEPQRDVYRRFSRELWMRAATKFGWAPPPELPPYADVATMDVD